MGSNTLWNRIEKISHPALFCEFTRKTLLFRLVDWGRPLVPLFLLLSLLRVLRAGYS